MVPLKVSLFFIVLLQASAALADPIPNSDESIDDFDKEFGILEDGAEKKKDEKKLKEAEEQIDEENEQYEAGKSTYFEKLNPESTLSKDEFEKEREGLIPEVQPDILVYFESRNIPGLLPIPESEKNDQENIAKMEQLYRSLQNSAPESFSSKDMGYVTPPKNQRTCGSCAAFAAAGLHEVCMIKAGSSKNGMDLSEQQLIDCGYNKSAGMNGCNGAYPSAYPLWFKDHGGVAAHENDYGYKGSNPLLSCPSTLKLWKSGSTVSDVLVDYQCNEDKLKTLVSTYGAVLVGIYASDRGFSNYGGGIFSQCSRGVKMNHAVLIVGYGTENGVDYWLGKNSWGASWGEGGFFKLRRGTNECGVGDVCVTASCTGGMTSEPAPAPPPPPAIPKSLTCDISRAFGPVTGTFTIKFGGKGVVAEYISTVTCTNGICQPVNPEGITNCCVYICGETTCV